MAKVLQLLTGSLSGTNLPEVTDADNGKILGVVNGQWGAMPLGLSSDYEAYDGTYEVTPTTEDQTLNTAQKVMSADLKINKIPYAEVMNTANGTTVTIGGE